MDTRNQLSCRTERHLAAPESAPLIRAPSQLDPFKLYSLFQFRCIAPLSLYPALVYLDWICVSYTQFLIPYFTLIYFRLGVSKLFHNFEYELAGNVKQIQTLVSRYCKDCKTLEFCLFFSYTSVILGLISLDLMKQIAKNKHFVPGWKPDTLGGQTRDQQH